MENKIEITRSFSYKLNAGNYETRDFFCSAKSEVVTIFEGVVDETSQKLYDFCKKEVIKAVNEYKRDYMSEKGKSKLEKNDERRAEVELGELLE